MTKLEALAKDCIENHTHRLVDKPTKQDIYLREESIFIQGYRQSEKRITDLEKQVKDLEWQLQEVAKDNDLYQKENAELDCQKNRNKACYSCANATERCFRNEIGCPCEKYKSYKDENARLKSIADFQTSSNIKRDFQLKRSKEQIAEAKEIISEFVKWANWQGSGCPSFKSIQDKAEQFLNSEVEE